MAYTRYYADKLAEFETAVEVFAEIWQISAPKFSPTLSRSSTSGSTCRPATDIMGEYYSCVSRSLPRLFNVLLDPPADKRNW
jgi:hypothetical protein